MADGRYLEKIDKFAISQQPFGPFSQNLATAKIHLELPFCVEKPCYLF